MRTRNPRRRHATAQEVGATQMGIARRIRQGVEGTVRQTRHRKPFSSWLHRLGGNERQTIPGARREVTGERAVDSPGIETLRPAHAPGPVQKVGYLPPPGSSARVDAIE